MKRVLNAAMAAVLYCGLWLHAAASPLPDKPAKSAEVHIGQGITDIRLGTTSLRVIRATVGTGTVSDFDTYTIYVLPAQTDEAWMHVTTPSTKGLGYNFRTYQSADANTQAIAFYRQGDQLFAVQASKLGPAADAKGERMTYFEFETFSFNQNDDIPMFDRDSKRRSQGKYVDASQALQREFFGQAHAR